VLFLTGTSVRGTSRFMLCGVCMLSSSNVGGNLTTLGTMKNNINGEMAFCAQADHSAVFGLIAAQSPLARLSGIQLLLRTPRPSPALP